MFSDSQSDKGNILRNLDGDEMEQYSSRTVLYTLQDSNLYVEPFTIPNNGTIPYNTDGSVTIFPPTHVYHIPWLWEKMIPKKTREEYDQRHNFNTAQSQQTKQPFSPKNELTEGEKAIKYLLKVKTQELITMFKDDTANAEAILEIISRFRADLKLFHLRANKKLSNWIDDQPDMIKMKWRYWIKALENQLSQKKK